MEAGDLKPGMVIEQVSSPKTPQLMAQSRYNDAAGAMLSRWLSQVGDWITHDWMGFKATEAVAPQQEGVCNTFLIFMQKMFALKYCSS